MCYELIIKEYKIKSVDRYVVCEIKYHMSCRSNNMNVIFCLIYVSFENELYQMQEFPKKMAQTYNEKNNVRDLRVFLHTNTVCKAI